MEKILEFFERNKKNIIIVVILLCFLYLAFISSSEYFTNKNSNSLSITNYKKSNKKYKETILSESPKIIYIENFINSTQAEHLMKIADKIKRPSTIDAQGDPYSLVKNVRSSESAHLGKARDKITLDIENAACDYVGLDTHHLEPMQVVVYEKGQKFNEHYDFFSPDSEDIKERGNRNKTILVYLNDIPKEEGGSTIFTKLGLKIQPKATDAVYFENMNENGVDYNTMHAGTELKSDTLKKYAINIWFREKPSW